MPDDVCDLVDRVSGYRSRGDQYPKYTEDILGDKAVGN
jgi:hypothetical protein